MILSVKNLKKYYGSNLAVDNVSFEIEESKIVGLLGPNGAGKTTIISMILGIVSYDFGKIIIKGYDILKERIKALENVNFVAPYALLLGNLTVYENLYFFSKLYGINDLKKNIEELILYFNLKNLRDKKYGVLSSGEQVRVNLAKAFINKPKLLLLDEPTASLDPAVAKDIRDRIKEFVYSKNCAVLWTSHNMYEIEDICDNILFLYQGKIILEGNPKRLVVEYGNKNLEELFIKIANNSNKNLH